MNNPHLNAVGFFETVDSPHGPVRFPGVPTWFSRTPGRVAGAAPLLGADTREVLEEVGLSAAATQARGQTARRMRLSTRAITTQAVGRSKSMVEFWRAGGSESATTMEAARKIEADGWDGQMFMDSQCLTADPYVRMGVWAAATERLKLSTGVTNPLTRHPAVTAAAAATVQSISGWACRARHRPR